MIELLNVDCMEYMATLPDKAFDLAIVDPPYGIGRFEKPSGSTRFKHSKEMQEDGLKWDKPPTQEYFEELFRVSENQIIWGANNFILPPSEYFCIWDKKQTVDNFATAEYAWVSMGLKKPAKIFSYSIHLHNQDDKIHPTQKPIKLYKWLLHNYAFCKHCKNEGCFYEDVVGDGGSKLLVDCEWCYVSERGKPKILDTHLGSGSSAIAAHQMGFDFVGCEIDKDYYEAACKRFKEQTAQLSLL